MMQRPWAPGTIDEWLPRKERLCWGGGGDGGGGGFGGDGGGGGGWGGDSGGGGGGWDGSGGGMGNTGGGDWGSSGSYDASGFQGSGDIGAWAGTAYDASTAGTGAGGGGDWGSFGATDYSGFDSPNPIFTDIAGPNPGVLTGGGDWGSAGAYSAALADAGPSGAMTDAGYGPGGGGGFYGGGPFGDYGGDFGGGGNYGGGGGGYTGGGGGKGGGGGFGGFGTAGTSAGGRAGGALGGSNMVAASPSGGRAFADTVGGGSLAGPASAGRSAAPTRSEAEVSSVVSTDSEAAPEGEGEAPSSDFGTPQTSEAAPTTSEAAPDAEAAPSLSDAAPAGNIGGGRDAAPAHGGQGSLPSTSAFGPQSLNADYQGSPYADMGQQTAPSTDYQGSPYADMGQSYSQGMQALSDLTQSALSGYDYQGSPYADMGGQPTAPDFGQVFQAFEAQPGWNPGEQMAGRAGLAEPTDWGANPYATPGALGRDFNQVFESFDTPTGMDLAGDLATPQGEVNPNSMFSMGWEPSNAYEGRGADYASGRAAQDYVTSLVSGAPLGVAAPGLLSALSATTTLSPTGLLGGTAVTGGILGGLFADAGKAPAPTALQPIDVEAVTTPPTQFAPLTPQEMARAIDVEIVPSADVVTAGQLQNVEHPSAPLTDAPPTQPQETQAQPQEAQQTQPQEAQEAQQPQEAQQAPPSLIEQVPALPPVQGLYDMAALPGALQQQPANTPMPTARPAEAPQPTLPPDRHGEGNPGGEGDPDQGSSVPPAPLAPAEPGGVTAADRAARGPNAQPEPQHVRNARQYLLGTANPGDTMNRQGPDVAIARLEPNFAVRLAAAIREARANGLPNASVFSAFRAPAFGVNPGYAAVSQHGRGVAVDMSGIGRPGSRDARQWYDIATRNGLYNPYGPNHGAEWNHYQATPETGRQAANRLGPNPRNPPANMVPTWREAGVRPVPDTPRAPADIPVRTAQPQPPPTPPTEVPTALPSPTMPLPPAETPAPVAPVDRPPVDIPAPIVPAPFLAPPRAGRADPAMLDRAISNITTQALRGIDKNTTKDTAIARGAAARAAMIQAGIPLSTARAALLELANQTAAQMGYARSDYLGAVGSMIDKGIAEAMQGYQPAKPGEVQGPYGFQPAAPAPEAAPGKRSEAPSLLQLAAAGGPPASRPAIEPGQLPGRAEGQAPLPGGLGQNLDPGDLLAPTDPRSEQVFPPTRDRGIFDPDMLQLEQQEQQQYQQDFDPRGQRGASLFDLLQNFNPISTAEARGGNLQAPRADPGTIQGRLSAARAPIFNELQTNKGLRNTLDLIVTGEVGSQGKAAVLGFLETAMNKVAAEASRQGRTPTGRDLLQYLNNRSYFPDTWGKIESGKIKGGALTDDLLSAIAAGSNITGMSTGNSSAKSSGSRFGGNPTNATIGNEHYGVENYAHHAAWYNAMGAPEAGRGIGSDFAAQPDMPAIAISPAPTMPMRGLAKGGRVADDEPVVVGEEGPEVFVPDQSGTVLPHMPQPGKGKNVDRWPKVPAPEYPGRYGGVEREYERQTRAAQNPIPSLMDMIDSERLRLNAANWQRMINDPNLIQLGRSRIEDRRYLRDYEY